MLILACPEGAGVYMVLNDSARITPREPVEPWVPPPLASQGAVDDTSVSDPPETLELLEKTALSPPAGRLPTARSCTVAPEVEQPPAQPPGGRSELRGCL